MEGYVLLGWIGMSYPCFVYFLPFSAEHEDRNVLKRLTGGEGLVNPRLIRRSTCVLLKCWGFSVQIRIRQDGQNTENDK